MKIKKMAGAIIGRKDGDGMLKTTAKVLLPIGAIQGAMEQAKTSANNVKSLAQSIADSHKNGVSYIECEIAPHMTMSMRLKNAKTLINTARYLILLSIIVSIFSTITAIGGDILNLTGDVFAVVIFLYGAKQVFLARGLTLGKFDYPTLGHFLVSERGWLSRCMLEGTI